MIFAFFPAFESSSPDHCMPPTQWRSSYHAASMSDVNIHLALFLIAMIDMCRQLDLGQDTLMSFRQPLYNLKSIQVIKYPQEFLCLRIRGFYMTWWFQRGSWPWYHFNWVAVENLNPLRSNHGLPSRLWLWHCIADRFLFTLSQCKLFKFTKLRKYFTDEQERVQKKTFTKWINTYLRKVSKTHYPIISATDYADSLVSVCLTGTCCCVKPHWLPDCVKPKNLSTMGDNEVTQTDNFEGYFEKKELSFL